MWDERWPVGCSAWGSPALVHPQLQNEAALPGFPRHAGRLPGLSGHPGMPGPASAMSQGSKSQLSARFLPS